MKPKTEDFRPAYELNDRELEELDDLARECGYCSIRECLTNLNWWDLGVDVIRRELASQLESGN